MTFDRVGPYRVLERIGRGGMGEIFTARDERLGRIVALKTISPGVVPDPESRQQLIAEARAAAALTHPFICTIHDALEHDGVPVIVMEYVKGETIADRVTTGPMPPSEICRIGVEVAEALAVAHAHGTIHRDISAANIMIASDGHAKVMDFGLARTPPPASSSSHAMTSSHVTRGLVVGTPPYLSPEALRGDPIDARADLYSFGVVLYLMATGRLPFVGETTTGLVAAILTQPPVAPRTLVPSLPPPLDAIVQKLLQKSPDARYAAAVFVGEALAGAMSDTGRGAVPRSVAVLPFRTLGQSAADDDLGLGLADATITELAAVRSLLVRPTAAIIGYHGRTVDPVHAGRELSVDAVVDGSLQRRGSNVRVTAQLLSTSGGDPLWGTKIDARIDDVFGLQDQVSREIIRALEVQLTDAEERRLNVAPRAGTEAQEHYLRGRVQLLSEDRADLDRAIQSFESAIRVDPRFARAYAGLAAAYSRIGFSFEPGAGHNERAVAMTERALTIDRDLPEGHYLKARLAWTPEAGFQHEVAIRALARTIVASPGLNEAHDALAIVLLHVSMLEEAAKEFERALAINPRDVFAYMHLGLVRYFAGDLAAAHDISQEAWRRKASAWAAYQLALVHLQQGNLEKAAQLSAEAASRFRGDVLFHSLDGVIAALQGDSAAADRHIADVVRHKRAFGHYHHPQYDVASIHAQLGRIEEAVTWLRDAASNGFPCAAFFARDRLLAPLHGQPGFETLLRELREENERYRRVYYESRESSA